MSNDNLGSNLVYFLLGAATGAALALLYAPQEGEATRKLITDKASEYKDKATEASTTVAQTAKEKLSMVQDKAQDLINRGQNAAHDGIDTAADKAHMAVNNT